MKLSTDAAPAYPPAASDAHIVGTVVVSATVGADGAVQSAQPVSGPALLEMAVLNAVRSWRYRPYLIYGKPVAFNTQVIIEFKPAAPPQ
jgi:protein TonB